MSDLKPATPQQLQQYLTDLVAAKELTPAQADEWREALEAKNLILARSRGRTMEESLGRALYKALDVDAGR